MQRGRHNFLLLARFALYMDYCDLVSFLQAYPWTFERVKGRVLQEVSQANPPRSKLTSLSSWQDIIALNILYIDIMRDTAISLVEEPFFRLFLKCVGVRLYVN